MAKRILTLLLALLMVTMGMVGCGKEKKESTPDVPAGPKPEKHFNEVVMTIGDIEITYELYRYFYMSCRANYESKGIAKTVDEIKAEVLGELFYESAVHTLVNRFDAGLTVKQMETIENEYQTLVQTYKEYGQDLQQTLETRYMTEKVYKDMYAFERYLTENVFNYCKEKENNVLDYSDEAVDKMLAEYNRAILIYVGVGEGDWGNRTDENAKKKVDGILEKLADGKEFSEVAVNYTDKLDTDTKVGFYFKKGGLITEIEEVFFNLEAGQYHPEAIKTEDGYYIVYRAQPDKEYFTENLYPYYSFNDLLKQTEESLSVIYSEFFTTMFDGKNLLPEITIEE